MKQTLMTCAVVILSSCATFNDNVHTSLLIGNLQSIQLTPGPTADENGRLEVSNSCGSANTQFSISSTIRGRYRGKMSVQSELNEWCHAPFSLSTEQYLLYVREQGGRVDLIFAEPIEYANDGRLLIIPKNRLLVDGIEVNQFRSPVELGEYRVDTGTIRPIDLEQLVLRGYVKESDGALFYTSVIYIDQLPATKKIPRD